MRFAWAKHLLFLSLFAAGALGALAAPVVIDLSPDGTNDMSAAFQAAVDEARRNPSGSVISLASGDYHFKTARESSIWVSNHDNPRPRRFFAMIEGVTNVTITCRGKARFVAEGEGVVLALVDTKNVKVENVVFDYLRPFYSLWTLKGGRLLPGDCDCAHEIVNGRIFALGPGWREPQTICELFDKETYAFRESVWWNGAADRIFAGHPDGTIAMTRSPYRPSPCVFLYRAVQSEFLDSGAFASSGMGFLAQRSEDIRIKGWRTREQRPLALQADATHFSNCRGRIEVTDSVFERMVDDAINVHSTSLRIIETPASDTLVCQYVHPQSVGFEVFLPGETLRFIKGAVFEPGAEIRVAAVKMRAYNIVELKLAGSIPAGYGKGDAVENADWQPSVSFARNKVRNCSARATLFTTPGKVVCSDNLFENVAGQSIYFAGDAWGWYESGACRDVLVARNVFRNCGFKTGRGMVQIEPTVHDLAAQKERYHRNIRIEGNKFNTFRLPLVWARSAENVVLKDNSIVNGNTNVVIIAGSADVRFE